MVGLRRFGLLIVLLGVCLVALIARLYDVQIREHDVWAREAANLVRSWFVEPYRRGAILDREGRTLVRDEAAYELEFVWRDFRRGHPLGQVAQLRSLVEMRPVSLAKTAALADTGDRSTRVTNLVLWAREFVHLSPAAIDRFGRGEALELGDHVLPAVEGGSRRARRDAARLERRGSRAADLHFYVKSLLDPRRRTWRGLAKKKDTPAWNRPYLELVAELRGLDSGMSLMATLERELPRTLDHLADLESRIDWQDFAPDELPGGRASLVELIEQKRRQVEFATADDMFERAAGFDPSRLAAQNLRRIDLEWLRRAMSWDLPRLELWCTSRGRAWELAIDEYLAGHAIARAKLRGDPQRSAADRVLSSLGFFFNGGRQRTRRQSAIPRDWWDTSETVVLADFASHFAGAEELPAGLLPAVLPVHGLALREKRAAPSATRSEWEQNLVRNALAGLPLPAWVKVDHPDVEPGAWIIEQLLAVATSGRRSWNESDERVFGAVLSYWNRLLQERVRECFDALPEVEFTSQWVTAALKDRAYVVRDREARPLDLDDDPAYELVHLVTRYPDRYAGFHVRSTTRRRQIAFLPARGDDLPIPVADPLVGSVRSPYLVSLLEQRPQEAALHEQRRAAERTEGYREMVVDHLSLNWQASESMGGRGLEGAYDQELSGRSGYRESSGLQDRQEGRAPVFVEAVDGEDLTTTLDLDLQRAAQAVIDFPDPPPAGDEKPDRVWHETPVGAIVLITVDGEVLAAASGPSTARSERELGLYQDDQGLHAGDRTLRLHTFQPPGSILKPFVAAWALDRGLDVTTFTASCMVRAEGDLASHRDGAKVHCLGSHGQEVHVHRALLKSCNSFFAKLGEDLYDGPRFREMGRSFGFDRSVFGDPGQASGRRVKEDWRSPYFFRDEDEEKVPVPTMTMLQRLGNGLTHISVTPMQVARAYAALATGRLPELRLVKRIGEQDQPAVWSDLPVSAESLEIVRAALRKVAVAGTAAGDGLDEATLGFTFACKTGSADYLTENVKVPMDPTSRISASLAAWKPGERKHGWVAGWFPAENPVAVAVVYVHDTSTTSSHVATHVMSQFLRTDAVVDWLREQSR